MTRSAEAINRREFLQLAGMSGAAIVLASCTSGPGGGGGTSTLNEWVVAASEDPTVYSNKLMVGGGVGSIRVQAQVFDALMMPEGKTFEETPFLATSWEIIEPTRIRLHLRDGVKFHNGADFSAEDVKYTVETTAGNPKLNANYFESAVERVDIVDSLTADLVLKSPYSPILYNMGVDPGIVSVQRKGNEAQYDKRPWGTGPYKYSADFVSGQPIHLEAFDGYWQGKATPEKLTIKLIQDASTRTAELLAGRAQIIETVSIADIPLIEASGKAEVRSTKASEGLGRLIEYAFNPSKPYFSDVRVRQALNYAVDRESIVNNIMEGHGAPIAGVTPKGWPGYLPEIEPWPYDPGKAKSLLRDAGQEGLQFTWEITDGVFLRDREIAETAAAQLAEVGVTANLRITERAVQFDHYFSDDGPYDMLTLQWPTAGDSDGNMIWCWNTSPPIVNYQPYDVLRQLTVQAQATYDADERRRIYEQLNRTAWPLCPWLYIQVQDQVWGKDKRISWEPFPNIGQATESWYYDRAALK